MNIGELAERSGLAASKIRFYEAQGLIQVERQGNGYRRYPTQTLQTLQLIQGAQRAGFSLQELKALMPDDSPSEAKRADIVLRLERRIAQIEELQARMDQSKAELRAVIATIQSHPEGTPCTQAQDKVWASIEAHKKTPRI
ncbi:MerR family transcriptional regulator [Pseudomonas sp. 1912-s]|uniref:MerR family transcriptional regulator n=1 Tax=Pseudomonas sp. 1912-s TaxID=3033802 RepID=UPI0023DE9DCA|nr:MerR family transcriptional regulator [Pseudomonas sp. 1912-s]MDF3203000.1 MerR family transcriptional regulator [Pseudomonas sp. 1912-s]